MSTSALLTALREFSVLHAPPDKPFVLKSGKTSPHYVDVRRTALTAKGLYLIAWELYHTMVGTMKLHPRRVAGVALCGCPLATALSLESLSISSKGPHSHQFDAIFDALYVRPEAKDHGTGNLVEGIFEPGDTVVLCEDVVTSGTSTLNAIRSLRQTGLKVIGVVAVLDREEGGGPRIQTECPFQSLTTLKELLANGDGT